MISQTGRPGGSVVSQTGVAAARLLAQDTARRGSAGKGLSREEAEKEKAYDDIERHLDGLKEQAQHINRTLDYHNQVIPEITGRVDKGQERLCHQKKAIKAMIG